MYTKDWILICFGPFLKVKNRFLNWWEVVRYKLWPEVSPLGVLESFWNAWEPWKVILSSESVVTAKKVDFQKIA